MSEKKYRLYFDGQSASVKVEEMMRERGLEYSRIERPSKPLTEDDFRCPTLQHGLEFLEGYRNILPYLYGIPTI